MKLTPDCDCSSRGPTYPTYRETPHLPDCVWFYINRLEIAVQAHIDTAEARERRLIRRIVALEAAATPPPEAEVQP